MSYAAKDDVQKKVMVMLHEIRNLVWLCDIPSPTVPEYIEHHEQIKSILKLIDEKLEEVDNL